MRADHPIKTLTKRKFMEASHALVSYRGGHRVIEEALERAGLARKIALRVPHFTVVPMVLERTDLILTLPARVARVFERRGKLKCLPPPVPSRRRKSPCTGTSASRPIPATAGCVSR